MEGDLAVTLGEILEAQQARVDPLVVRVRGGEGGLDLLVLDDPPGHGVHEEHPAWLEAALADDRRLLQFEHADLGCEHDEAVVGHPITARTQAVAVEHRADLAAVGERDERGAVPRFHQRRVELVERATCRVHLLMVFPGLRDHHQHGVRQRAATEVEQLEDLVEARGVAGVAGDDRVDPLEVTGDQVGFEQRFAGVHPVSVAAQGVDLAVVCHVAVRVGQRPRRERVGGEAGVHQADRAFHALVGQVVEELRDLALGEHSFVDDGARGQAWEIDLVVEQLVFGSLAHAERGALQGQAGPVALIAAAPGQEKLGEVRHGLGRGGADMLGVHGEFAPAEHLHVLFGGDALDGGHGAATAFFFLWKESRADRVRARLGQLEIHDLAVELVRDLDQQTGAVAGVGFGAAGPAMFQVAQRDQGLCDDRVISAALQVSDEGDTAGVVFVLTSVQAMLLELTDLGAAKDLPQRGDGTGTVGHGWPPPKALARPVLTPSSGSW